MVRDTARWPIHELHFPMSDAAASSLPRQLAIELFIVLAIGFALGLLGPFGSYAIPLDARLLYWMGFGLIGYAIFRPVNIAAESAADATQTPLWLAIILSALIAALPMTLLIGSFLEWLQYGSGYLEESFAVRYAQIGGIGIAIYALTYLVFRKAPSEERTAATDQIAQENRTGPAGAAQTALHSKLPVGFPAIIALSVEDHYVKVHGENVTEMLLMNLSDAIALMPEGSGIQTHRSWWVASNAVIGTSRSGRNQKLKLPGGTEAPISRANVAKVRATGLLN